MDISTRLVLFYGRRLPEPDFSGKRKAAPAIRGTTAKPGRGECPRLFLRNLSPAEIIYERSCEQYII